MGNADDLPNLSYLAELYAYLLGSLTAYARIYLIKDHSRDRVLVRDNAFESKHYSRKLTARCNLGDGLGLLALVGGDKELHSIHAVDCELSLLMLHGNDDSCHIEKFKFLGNSACKALRNGLAVVIECLCLLCDLVKQSLALLRQFLYLAA